MRVIWRFIKNVYADYNKIDLIWKSDKRACYLRMLKLLSWSIYNSITALFVYPIWFIFRKSITKAIHKGTHWQEVQQNVEIYNIGWVEEKLKSNGKFLFWLWTYGDIDNPLDRGGMPVDYGKNNFWNRYKWSAIRNPRFNINYLYYKTDYIRKQSVVIDTRNFSIQNESYGVGDSPVGIYFKWVQDNKYKWYFIYEDNSKEHSFWFGYVGLTDNDPSWKRGRFEMSYRKIKQ